jgi:hypothetical protein
MIPLLIKVVSVSVLSLEALEKSTEKLTPFDGYRSYPLQPPQILTLKELGLGGICWINKSHSLLDPGIQSPRSVFQAK